ncbi:hypothetical protein V6O07_23090, partial [Arthrospira platensis SPKY2]
SALSIDVGWVVLPLLLTFCHFAQAGILKHKLITGTLNLIELPSVTSPENPACAKWLLGLVLFSILFQMSLKCSFVFSFSIVSNFSAKIFVLVSFACQNLG